MKFKVNICTTDNNNINSNCFTKNWPWVKKNQVLNGEPVLSLSCLVEYIQTNTKQFIIVDSDLTSHKNHNVDDPNKTKVCNNNIK